MSFFNIKKYFYLNVKLSIKLINNIYKDKYLFSCLSKYIIINLLHIIKIKIYKKIFLLHIIINNNYIKFILLIIQYYFLIAYNDKYLWVFFIA